MRLTKRSLTAHSPSLLPVSSPKLPITNCVAKQGQWNTRPRRVRDLILRKTLDQTALGSATIQL
eukprot:scaffold984_cov281-Chaetoceros_neogracile.AAC.27